MSGPIVEDKLMGRIAFRTDDADGWITNTLLNEQLETRNKYHVRGSLLANVSEQFEALLIVEGIKDKSTPQGAFSIGRVNPNRPSSEDVFAVPWTGFR